MPRKPRIYSNNTKVYHVMSRGIDKQNIFLDESDKIKFLSELKGTKEKYEYEIYTYCLMDNHVHLVIYDKEENLSTAMHSLSIRYSLYFNKKYDRVGHLFQNRFLSKNIEDREYLLQVCRYIHQNPEKAGIAKTEEYRWSSYKEYIQNPQITNTNLILSLFSSELEEAKRQFIKFHKLNIFWADGTDLIDFEMNTKLKDEEVIKCIKNILKIENIAQIKEYSVEKRNKEIEKLKQIKGTTCLQIARVTGINRKIIEKLIKNDKEI